MVQREERRYAEPQRLTSWTLPQEEPESYEGYERRFRYDDGTDLFKPAGVLLFVKFLIDVSHQTSVNEFQVFPACLVSISIDHIEHLADDHSLAGDAVGLFVAVGKELARHTRKADKAGRTDRTFLVLLTRTMARTARDHYVPRMAEILHAAAKEEGIETTFSFGIASLTEHLVTDPDDMLAKSQRALEAAQEGTEQTMERGPARVAVYDFRSMPIERGGD